MQRLIAYVTGTFALLLVAASAVSALTYALLHRSETLSNLATSTLSGTVPLDQLPRPAVEPPTKPEQPYHQWPRRRGWFRRR